MNYSSMYGTETIAYGTDVHRPFTFKMRLAEIDGLITSHDDAFNPNPAYIPELQPRRRDRFLDRQQVDGIAARPNPLLLLENSLQIGTGIPVVGKDNMVECGNGRIMGLRRAARENINGYKAYVAALSAALPSYGFPGDALANFRAPVLVRERQTEFDTLAARANFAEQCNVKTTASYSPTEQAATDKNKLPDDVLASLIMVGDNIDTTLLSPQNKAIVNEFLARTPPNEAGEMLDASGKFNSAGLRRLRSAVFASTFSGNTGEVLAQTFLENPDPVIRNILKAIDSSLGVMAKAEAKARMSGGAGFTKDLAAAINKLAVIKKQGMSAQRYLAQADMFDAPTPLQKQLIYHLEDVSKYPTNAIEFLQKLSDEVIKDAETAQPKGQAAFIDPTPRKSAEQILADAIKWQTTSKGELARLMGKNQMMPLKDIYAVALKSGIVSGPSGFRALLEKELAAGLIQGGAGLTAMDPANAELAAGEATGYVSQPEAPDKPIQPKPREPEPEPEPEPPYEKPKTHRVYDPLTDMEGTAYDEIKRFSKDHFYIGIKTKTNHPTLGWQETLSIYKFKGRPSNIYEYQRIIAYAPETWAALLERVKAETETGIRTLVVTDDYAYSVPTIVSTPKTRPWQNITIGASDAYIGNDRESQMAAQIINDEVGRRVQANPLGDKARPVIQQNILERLNSGGEEALATQIRAAIAAEAKQRGEANEIEQSFGKEDWQVPLRVYVERAGNRVTAIAKHRELVAKAVAEGKPVPAEVLADYPEFTEKSRKPKRKGKDTKAVLVGDVDIMRVPIQVLDITGAVRQVPPEKHMESGGVHLANYKEDSTEAPERIFFWHTGARRHGISPNQPRWLFYGSLNGPAMVDTIAGIATEIKGREGITGKKLEEVDRNGVMVDVNKLITLALCFGPYESVTETIPDIATFLVGKYGLDYIEAYGAVEEGHFDLDKVKRARLDLNVDPAELEGTPFAEWAVNTHDLYDAIKRMREAKTTDEVAEISDDLAEQGIGLWVWQTEALQRFIEAKVDELQAKESVPGVETEPGDWSVFTPNELGYQKREYPGLAAGYFIAQQSPDRFDIVESERGNTKAIIEKRQSGWHFQIETPDWGKFKTVIIFETKEWEKAQKKPQASRQQWGNPLANAILNFNHYLEMLEDPAGVTKDEYIRYGGSELAHRAAVAKRLEKKQFVAVDVVRAYPDLYKLSDWAKTDAELGSPTTMPKNGVLYIGSDRVSIQTADTLNPGAQGYILETIVNGNRQLHPKVYAKWDDAANAAASVLKDGISDAKTGAELDDENQFTGEDEAKEPWEMTEAEFEAYEENLPGYKKYFWPACDSPTGKALYGREACVAKALSEGKTIPAEILAEFPQLTNPEAVEVEEEEPGEPEPTQAEAKALYEQQGLWKLSIEEWRAQNPEQKPKPEVAAKGKGKGKQVKLDSAPEDLKWPYVDRVHEEAVWYALLMGYPVPEANLKRYPHLLKRVAEAKRKGWRPQVEYRVWHGGSRARDIRNLEVDINYCFPVTLADGTVVQAEVDLGFMQMVGLRGAISETGYYSIYAMPGAQIEDFDAAEADIKEGAEKKRAEFIKDSEKAKKKPKWEAGSGGYEEGYFVAWGGYQDYFVMKGTNRKAVKLWGPGLKTDAMAKMKELEKTAPIKPSKKPAAPSQQESPPVTEAGKAIAAVLAYHEETALHQTKRLESDVAELSTKFTQLDLDEVTGAIRSLKDIKRNDFASNDEFEDAKEEAWSEIINALEVVQASVEYEEGGEADRRYEAERKESEAARRAYEETKRKIDEKAAKARGEEPEGPTLQYGVMGTPKNRDEAFTAAKNWLAPYIKGGETLEQFKAGQMGVGNREISMSIGGHVFAKGDEKGKKIKPDEVSVRLEDGTFAILKLKDIIAAVGGAEQKPLGSEAPKVDVNEEIKRQMAAKAQSDLRDIPPGSLLVPELVAPGDIVEVIEDGYGSPPGPPEKHPGQYEVIKVAAITEKDGWGTGPSPFYHITLLYQGIPGTEVPPLPRQESNYGYYAPFTGVGRRILSPFKSRAAEIIVIKRRGGGTQKPFAEPPPTPELPPKSEPKEKEARIKPHPRGDGWGVMTDAGWLATGSKDMPQAMWFETVEDAALEAKAHGYDTSYDYPFEAKPEPPKEPPKPEFKAGDSVKLKNTEKARTLGFAEDTIYTVLAIIEGKANLTLNGKPAVRTGLDNLIKAERQTTGPGYQDPLFGGNVGGSNKKEPPPKPPPPPPTDDEKKERKVSKLIEDARALQKRIHEADSDQLEALDNEIKGNAYLRTVVTVIEHALGERNPVGLRRFEIGKQMWAEEQAKRKQAEASMPPPMPYSERRKQGLATVMEIDAHNGTAYIQGIAHKAGISASGDKKTIIARLLASRVVFDDQY